MAGQLSAKKKEKTFFDNYYADFFYKLAQSPQFSTFAKVVSQSGEKGAYANWHQDNPQQAIALDNWVKATVRNF